MLIFLTGGTGYIGWALAQRLVADGHQVRALVRPTSDAEGLRRMGIATFVGDLAERESMRAGMAGADWVIHAAAELNLSVAPARMRRANVSGSDNVAGLACELGIPRFLSVSSIAYFGGSPEDGSAADEESPPWLPLPTLYNVTKHAAELAIQRWASRGLPVNTVYPSIVYGPPSGRRGVNKVFRALLDRRLPFVAGGDRRLTWIYLEDLVDGMARLLGKAPPGRAYLMTGAVATVREVVDRLCEIGGVPPPRLELPLGPLRVAATLAWPLLWLRGRRPPYSAEQLNSLRRHSVFDDRRARVELGWHPRGLDEGLPPTVEHLRSA